MGEDARKVLFLKCRTTRLVQLDTQPLASTLARVVLPSPGGPREVHDPAPQSALRRLNEDL